VNIKQVIYPFCFYLLFVLPNIALALVRDNDSNLILKIAVPILVSIIYLRFQKENQTAQLFWVNLSYIAITVLFFLFDFEVGGAWSFNLFTSEFVIVFLNYFDLPYPSIKLIMYSQAIVTIHISFSIIIIHYFKKRHITMAKCVTGRVV